jgi:hypothetical protein
MIQRSFCLRREVQVLARESSNARATTHDKAVVDCDRRIVPAIAPYDARRLRSVPDRRSHEIRDSDDDADRSTCAAPDTEGDSPGRFADDVRPADLLDEPSVGAHPLARRVTDLARGLRKIVARSRP